MLVPFEAEDDKDLRGLVIGLHNLEFHVDVVGFHEGIIDIEEFAGALVRFQGFDKPARGGMHFLKHFPHDTWIKA